MGRFELDERGAFPVVSRFVRQFANRAGDDLPALPGDVGIEADSQTMDLAGWEDWMGCVRSVVADAEGPAGGGPDGAPSSSSVCSPVTRFCTPTLHPTTC